MLMARHHPSKQKQCGEAAVFVFAASHVVLTSLDALLIFVCIFYGLRAALRMRVQNLHIDESSIETRAPQTVCIDVQSSVIISKSGITQENFSID